MRTRVLLFGPFAAAAGASSVEVEAGASPTAGEVLASLPRASEALTPLMPGARLAINCAFADPAAIVREGDEVALIGLVSGG